MRAKTKILVAVLAVVYVMFLAWFQGTAEPLTTEEVEATLARIQVNGERHGRHSDPQLMDALRSLMSSDDGKPFYMLNLIRYNEKALYPPGSDYGGDAKAAELRYARLLMPYLLKNGNLPVFAGSVRGTFLQPQNAEQWDSVGIVRYRSRRDLLGMLMGLSEDPVDVGVHKWASIQNTQVFPVQSELDLIAVRGLAAVVLGMFGLLLHGLLSLVPAYRR